MKACQTILTTTNAILCGLYPVLYCWSIYPKGQYLCLLIYLLNIVINDTEHYRHLWYTRMTIGNNNKNNQTVHNICYIILLLSTVLCIRRICYIDTLQVA